MTAEIRSSDHVPLDWNDFYYTNCPLVSASNVDQELGWVREELKKIGIEYSFLRSRRENNWYPHYIHNMDNLMRAGGVLPGDRMCKPMFAGRVLSALRTCRTRVAACSCGRGTTSTG